MARYTGAWQRLAEQTYEEQERFTVSTRTDPAHGDMSDAGPPLMMDAPTLQGGGEITTDVLWENVHSLPASSFIDTTPVEGHGTPEESGHGFGGNTTPGASIQKLASKRGKDKGAHHRETRTTATYRFFNETFFGYFTKGFEPPPITHNPGNPVFIRGINSHPVNNGPQARPTAWTVDGDGWKRGDYESSNVERDFSPPNRHHMEVKTVEPDIVTIIGDVQPPPESDTYASPFSSLQKFLPKRRKIGGIRRDPGPWDEDLVARSAGEITISSADGMVAN